MVSWAGVPAEPADFVSGSFRLAARARDGFGHALGQADGVSHAARQSAKKSVNAATIPVSNRFTKHGPRYLMTISALAAVALIAYLVRGALAAGTRLEQISQERQERAVDRD